ncbi:MAG: prephenate dehydratase [Firmicutes bacterium]|nr:prephenate dehydratase [Bacillota bacterium]
MTDGGTAPVAIQGDRGCNSEAAARRAFGEAVEILTCRTLQDVFEELAAGHAAFAVVPVENSTAGSVVDTYDLLWEHSPAVVGEVVLRVRHALMALPGVRLEEVRRVVSHPQALAQCRRFLRALGAEAVPAWDTAGSARWIAERGERDAAALAPPLAAAIHGLEVLADGVEDAPGNATRFLVLARADGAGGGAGAWGGAGAAGGAKTTVGFVTEHRPGALYEALGSFARHGLNLTKIESRPDPAHPWHFRFFADVAGDAQKSPLREALAELRAACREVRVFGSYAAWPEDQGPAATT